MDWELEVFMIFDLLPFLLCIIRQLSNFFYQISGIVYLFIYFYKKQMPSFLLYLNKTLFLVVKTQARRIIQGKLKVHIKYNFLKH